MSAAEPVVVVGGGMGGLTAAIRLAQRGDQVVILEARSEVGGLASSLTLDGLTFDAGPYILLDRPGLTWAFHQLGLDLEALVPLRRIEHIYQVEAPGGETVRFEASAAHTAEGLEARWPGSARRYLRFVAEMRRIHARLQPLLYVSRPGVGSLLASGGWRHAWFLRRSLAAVLRATALPQPVSDAIAIWTHVAGQTPATAPSPLAFVPALMHEPGAFYPLGGISAVVDALRAAAVAAGVVIRTGTRVQRIRSERGMVTGVELAGEECIQTTRVLSNAHGVGTYATLVQGMPAPALARLARLPLQSPGVCCYLAVKARSSASALPYLRFHLPGGDDLCRLLVMPWVVVPEVAHDGWVPARLIAPMRHEDAQRLGSDGQRAFAERLLAEPWWRAQVDEVRVLQVRTPSDWGALHHLHRDSMNPVMTASFMRSGRLAHRSPYLRGLALAGSSTHPGQWLSFSAISGILAADQVQPAC